MPELPEVEVVRRGLARWAAGARITEVEVRHPRPVRRHAAGAADFRDRLVGTRVDDAVRRGKFLWLLLDSGEALLAHLGMSGQLLLEPAAAPDEAHLRVRIGLDGAAALAGRELRFVDQRMFGGLSVVPLVPTADGGPGGLGLDRAGLDRSRLTRPGIEQPGLDPLEPGPAVLPLPVAHIARDVLDPWLDEVALTARIRARRTGVKRALLDQGLVSGVGNIYADEALWRVGLHYARPTERLTRPQVGRLLSATRDVMTEALGQGGTSFDSLYVDVFGSNGYFERELAVYGRQGQECLRCGRPVRRDAFMNRSSFSCPRCQPRPRQGRG